VGAYEKEERKHVAKLKSGVPGSMREGKRNSRIHGKGEKAIFSVQDGKKGGKCSAQGFSTQKGHTDESIKKKGRKKGPERGGKAHALGGG